MFAFILFNYLSIINIFSKNRNKTKQKDVLGPLQKIFADSWLSTSMTFTVQESTHRPPSSPNLSSPLRSLYSFRRSPPERLFFPKTLQLCVLYWKKVMGFISEPWKQTSHSTLSVFLEASTNTSLLEDKKCKTCIHLFSRLKPTGNSYEPWTIAPASRIKGYLNEILHEVKTRRTEGKS